MTLGTAFDLAVFLGEITKAIVERVSEAFASGEEVTAEDINAATEKVFAGWESAKERHWRLVNNLADEAEQSSDAAE